jgi:hypothetical protein
MEEVAVLEGIFEEYGKRKCEILNKHRDNLQGADEELVELENWLSRELATLGFEGRELDFYDDCLCEECWGKIEEHEVKDRRSGKAYYVTLYINESSKLEYELGSVCVSP